MASSPELTLWRLVRPDFAPGLDGKGAEIWGGRWNSPGRPVVYCAGHLSLAVLEYFVHLPPQMRRAGAMPQMVAVRLAIPEGVVQPLPGMTADDLRNPQVCRERGDAWLRDSETLAVSVPSAVVPQELNCLLNPRHRDFASVRLIEATPFEFDPRMAG